MRLEKGSPVRVKLLDGGNYAGLVEDSDEDNLVVQCIYKFVSADQQEGFEEKVSETLAMISIRELLIMAAELEVLKVATLALALKGKKGLTSVMTTAMIEGMEPILIAQQAPISMVFPRESISYVSSLLDEGQEKLFERWAEQ